MKESPLVLTRDNYYSKEADWEYMSCSQWQGFRECEARQIAKLEGRWADEDSKALLVGNYFHSYLESKEAHKEFCNEHFDKIYKTRKDKKTGLPEIVGKYADYEHTDTMITKLLNNPTARKFYDMSGEVERIMTGVLFGMPWRIRMDKFFPEKNIILDWKTSADFRKLTYNRATREMDTFAESWGYLMRAAVYAEIVKQNTGVQRDPLFIITAVSKHDYPDIAHYSLNHKEVWQYELEQIQDRIFHVQEVKARRRPPVRCGECDYCRSTNNPTTIVPYYELKPGMKPEKDYENLPEAPIQTAT